MTGRVTTRPAIPVTPQEDEAFADLAVCRIPGCHSTHQLGEFCCAAHWRLLPGYLRDDVWAGARAGTGTREWCAAAAAAVRFLIGPTS